MPVFSCSTVELSQCFAGESDLGQVVPDRGRIVIGASLLPFRTGERGTLFAGEFIASSLPLTLLSLCKHGRCIGVEEKAGSYVARGV